MLSYLTSAITTAVGFKPKTVQILDAPQAAGSIPPIGLPMRAPTGFTAPQVSHIGWKQPTDGDVSKACRSFYDQLDIVRLISRAVQLDSGNQKLIPLTSASRRGSMPGIAELKTALDNIVAVLRDMDSEDGDLAKHPMLYLWFMGGGVMRTQQTSSTADTKTSVLLYLTISTSGCIESRLNHESLNSRMSDDVRYLRTLPGEFIVFHEDQSTSVETSGLELDAYTLNLGPSVLGRTAQYGLVAGIARALDSNSSVFSFLTSRHWVEGRMSKTEIFVYVPAVDDSQQLTNPTSEQFGKCTLLVTLWRRIL